MECLGQQLTDGAQPLAGFTANSDTAVPQLDHPFPWELDLAPNHLVLAFHYDYVLNVEYPKKGRPKPSVSRSCPGRDKSHSNADQIAGLISPVTVEQGGHQAQEDSSPGHRQQDFYAVEPDYLRWYPGD